MEAFFLYVLYVDCGLVFSASCVFCATLQTIAPWGLKGCYWLTDWLAGWLAGWLVGKSCYDICGTNTLQKALKLCGKYCSSNSWWSTFISLDLTFCTGIKKSHREFKYKKREKSQCWPWPYSLFNQFYHTDKTCHILRRQSDSYFFLLSTYM